MLTRNGALAAVLGMLMAGCATNPKPLERDTEAFASKLIAEKVSVAADAQRDYATLVAEDRAVIDRKQALLAIDEVDVEFIGKPEELLQAFAYRYGYRYVEAGKPVNLRVINVRMKKVPPEEVIRSVYNQVYFGAEVQLDKEMKVIRVAYKPDRQEPARRKRN